MSSSDSWLALKRTAMGVLLLRPGGVLIVVGTVAGTADVGVVARLPTTDVDAEPDRLLLLPLALLLALLPVRGKRVDKIRLVSHLHTLLAFRYEPFGNLSESMVPAPTINGFVRLHLMSCVDGRCVALAYIKCGPPENVSKTSIRRNDSKEGRTTKTAHESGMEKERYDIYTRHC